MRGTGTTEYENQTAACLRPYCGLHAQCVVQPEIDREILTEVNGIRAIDNHTHPVRFVADGGLCNKADSQNKRVVKISGWAVQGLRISAPYVNLPVTPAGQARRI